MKITTGPSAVNRRRLLQCLLTATLVTIGAAVPLFGVSTYILNVTIIAYAFIIISTAFNIVYGYTGLLSLAQIGFWGIGAYASAITVTRIGLSPWAAFIVAGIVSTSAAVLIGFPSLRLSRSAFIIVSLIFTLLLELLARDWVSLTRGPAGIPGLPAPQIALLDSTITFDRPHEWYYLMFGLTVMLLAIFKRVISSRLGRSLVAIKENEQLAISQGLDTLRYKLFAFSLSAFATGIAGGVFVFYLSVVDPSIFSFYYTQAMLIIVMAGGPGTYWEVVIAALVFSAVPEFLRMATDLRLILYGAILILVTLLMPDGVGGYLRKQKLKRSKERATLKAFVQEGKKLHEQS